MAIETLTSLKGALDEALDRVAQGGKVWRDNDRVRQTHPTPAFRVKPGMTKKANDDF